MAQITTPLLYIYNGSTFVALSGIKEYKITRNKLWKEAKRNMAGDMVATFIGIFPKIEVKFKPTNDDYIKTLVGILDTPYIKLKWWDDLTGDYKNGTFYTNDYTNELISKKGIAYEKVAGVKHYHTYYKEFEVHFIPVKKGGNDLNV